METNKQTAAANMIETLLEGSDVQINGKTYTIERCGEHVITVRGKRGAQRGLVQNVHSGAWYLTSSTGSERVESFGVAR